MDVTCSSGSQRENKKKNNLEIPFSCSLYVAKSMLAEYIAEVHGHCYEKYFQSKLYDN
jgi:hypothetical protein